MLKCYLKGPEMLAHGKNLTDKMTQWCHDNGIVRIEWEGKRKLLAELGMTQLGDWTMAKIVQLFGERTAGLRKIEQTIDEQLIASLPRNLRTITCAWLAGHDVRGMVSQATFYRHRRTLESYGINIGEARNVTRLNVKPIELELHAVEVPDWYSLEAA